MLKNFSASLKPRLRAMGIHAMISLVVFVATAFVLVFLFYPSVHFQINGGWYGLKLMFFIDLVLGPLITLLVFNPSKPKREKISDLTIIAVLQAAALAYGFHTVYQQRPVMLMLYAGATMETVTHENFVLSDSLKGADLSALPRLTKLPLAAYDPERKHENHGLVAPTFQLDNLKASQTQIKKELTEEQQNRLGEEQKNYPESYVVKLVGSFETEWILLDKDLNYLNSLGSTPTIGITMPDAASAASQ